MIQHYNERLSELKAKQRQKANWKQLKNYLNEELKRKIEERNKWEKQLDREQRDVDRLKGLRLGALFYTLIGKKEEKLTKEEAELLQAKLQYEEAEDTVEEMEKELAQIAQGLEELRYLESDIEAVMREKEQHILENHPALAAELEQLSEEAAEVLADVKELKEAVTAGHTVSESLDRAKEHLDSAHSWGAYDMVGGGVIATAVKHNRIDDARSAIHSAQSGLRRFQCELKDVQRDVRIEIDMNGLLTFSDFFFDGFIIDWVVQGRIKDAVQQVEHKRTYVRRIISGLENELAKKEALIAELKRKQNALVEQA
ncbi:hypothetical protein ACFQZE_11915 [Paenibacillus sp. GCM10027627]|uniref:hypothetical protein n=1 Tax=unclassified Paenibacillus TaxID=185978 RepID=UPI00362D13D9